MAKDKDTELPMGQSSSEPAEDVVDSAALLRELDVKMPVERASDHDLEIPYQAKISISVTADGTIELEQEGQHGHDDDAHRIHIAPVNAVKVARSILRAAGFNHILMATGDGGGWADLHNGALAKDFK